MKRKLFLFLALMLTSISTWAYQTPVADGIYYLYNTGCTSGETGFMSTGNDYGFQVVVDKFGFPLKLISVEDGKYRFQFIHHNGYLSDNGFMYSDGDTGRARTITIQDQGNGTYKLINTDNSKEIELWYDHNVVGDGAGNRKDYLWQFFSKAERDAVVAGYTTSVKLAAATSMGMPASVDTESEFDDYLSTNYIGIDQSSKITNGTFDTNHVTTDWSTTANSNRTFNIGWGGVEPTTTPEVYEGAGYLTHTTISVDKAGLYKVSVNATYRCGNSENNNRIGDLGYDGSVAYLQANSNIAKLGDWYSGKINGNGPGNPSEANSVYFAAGKYLTEVYVYVGDAKTIDISLHSHAFTWGGWLMFNNFKLTYYSDEVSDEDATAILATANGLLAQEMDATIKTNLTNAKNTFDGARTIANYNALDALLPEAQASVDAYALFAPERTKALALGMDADDIAALAPDVNALMVAEYNFVTTNYSYGVSLGAWTTVNAIERSGQHWDGTNASTYSEQNEGWGSSSWNCSYSQNITLPAGKYVFKVAGRKSSDAAVLTLKVTKGNEEIGTVNDFPNGDTGKGIDKSGVTNFGDGDFANNGIGRGWQWRYVQFTLADPATVNVSVTGSATALYQWVGFCNATVQTDDEDNVDLMEALVNLNSAITTATLTKNTTNVGSGIFQLDETTNNSVWSAYESAKSDAEDYEFTSSSTAEEVNALATALTTAITNYLNQPLNAPDPETHYNIVVATAGHAKFGNAIVMDRLAEYPHYNGKYIDNNTGFTLSASAARNVNLAQACVFTPVAGKANTYYISTERTEGTVYWTYGSLNDSQVNWNASQIQATTESSKKGEFKIAATTTANVFNIVNTTSVGGTIACQTGGSLYTEAGNADFSLADASQATPNLTVVAGVNWATFMSPFAVNLSELSTLEATVEAYTVTDVDEGVTVMSAVSEGIIPANTPVLLYRATTGSNYKPELSGWGTAAANTYDEGLLTGSYVKVDIPLNSYALQKKNDVVGFYKVTSEGIQAGANRAYLTVSGDPGAREAFFLEDDETGINTIGENAACTLQDLLNGADVYDLSGRKVTGVLEKNKVYIVNGNKIYVK